MRVTLFSPTHRRTPVAHVTAELVRGFRQRDDAVTVIASELSAPARQDRVPGLGDAVDWRDESTIRHVDLADIVLHQLGDSFADYAGGLFWVAKAGGTLILQDVSFGRLIGGWVATSPQSVGAFLRSAGLTGRLGELRRRDVGDGSASRWLLPYADGVVAHSTFVRAALGAQVEAPVALLDPPVAERDAASAGDGDAADGRIRILTAAELGPVGAVDTVIHAIASRRDTREAVEYRVAANLANEVRRYLELLAEDLGVRLTVSDAPGHDVLARELRNADAVIAPSDRPQASAPPVIVQAMRAGRAVIVPDDGFGADLPGNAVISYRRHDGHEALGRVLSSLVDGLVDTDVVGKQAAQIAGPRFRIDDYVRGIVELAPRAARHGAVRGLDQEFGEFRGAWEGRMPAEVFQRYLDDTSIFRS